MDTNTIELPLFFSSPSSHSPYPPQAGKQPDTKRPCHTRSYTNTDGAQTSPASDRKRFPLIEKAAVECIIWLGGHASFQIICEHVSNVLTLHHKRDFPASKLYYAAIQACLFNATDIFVPESNGMWGVTPEVQERGAALCNLKRQSKHTEHLCKLTNKLVLGMPLSFQLSDLGDDDDDNEDSGTGHGGSASHQTAQKKGAGNKKKAAPQKTPRKKGGASNVNAATITAIKQESVSPPPPPPPQFSSVAEAPAKASVNSPPEPKKPASEVVVKKEKEAYPQKSRGTSPDNSSQRTPKASDEESSPESGAATDGGAGAKIKKDEDGANRNSQCAFCGKQIQVAKRYVFYTAENGKDVDYIGGKRNALGKRKYPASGHVCNDCYKSNGIALRKEKSDEPEAKRRRNNRVIRDDDDDDEDDEVDYDEALSDGKANGKNVGVKMECEEDEEDKNSAKEGKNDDEEEEDGLVDISIDCKNVDDFSDEGNDSDAKKEDDSKEGSSEDSAKLVRVQEMIASMMYSKAKGSGKNDDRHGVTEDEIRSYIARTIDNSHGPSTRRSDQTHKNKLSSQELPGLITKALGLTDSKFKFVKNGKLWHLDQANSDVNALKDLK